MPTRSSSVHRSVVPRFSESHAFSPLLSRASGRNTVDGSEIEMSPVISNHRQRLANTLGRRGGTKLSGRRRKAVRARGHGADNRTARLVGVVNDERQGFAPSRTNCGRAREACERLDIVWRLSAQICIQLVGGRGTDARTALGGSTATFQVDDCDDYH
jgi:hypothetical protein